MLSIIGRLRHPEKASVWIAVTVLGITTFSSDLQSLKAFSPINVTLFGIVKDVIDEQL